MGKANVLMVLGPSLATLITGMVLGRLGSARALPLLGMELNLYQAMLTTAGIGALLAALLFRGVSRIN